MSRPSATPLFMASGMGYERVVELLLQQPSIDVNQASEYCGTDCGPPLLIASLNGNMGVVEQLLGHPSIEVNKANYIGVTSLHVASLQGHAKVVELLMKNKELGVNLPEHEGGRTPLITAVHEGHEDVVKLLLSHPMIDINITDKKSWGAINYARWFSTLSLSSQKFKRIYEMLKTSGARENKKMFGLF